MGNKMPMATNPRWSNDATRRKLDSWRQMNIVLYLKLYDQELLISYIPVPKSETLWTTIESEGWSHVTRAIVLGIQRILRDAAVESSRRAEVLEGRLVVRN